MGPFKKLFIKKSGAKKSRAANVEFQKRNLELVMRAKNGDLAAVNEFVDANIALVRSTMRGMDISKEHLPDIMQEIKLYFLKGLSLQKFDPARAKMLTYFSNAFKYAINEFRQKRMGLVSATVYKSHCIPHIKRIKKELKMVLGRKPTKEEIVQEGLQEWKARMNQRRKSIDPKKEKIARRALESAFSDPPAKIVSKNVWDNVRSKPTDAGKEAALVKRIEQEISEWANGNEKYKKILTLRIIYGKTLTEIARQTGLSGEGVRKIIIKGKRYLEKRLK